MKKTIWLLLLMVFSIGATRNVVPRADNEGNLGTVSKNWATVFSTSVTSDSLTVSDASISGTLTGVELTDLSDINSSTQTDGNLLVSNGVGFNSTVLTDANIPDELTITNQALTNLTDVNSSTQTAANLLISNAIGFGSVGVSGDVTLTEGGVTTIPSNTVLMNEVNGINSSTQTDGNFLISNGVGFNSLQFILPNSNDTDVSVEGQLSWDNDDDALRGYDGTRQVAVGQATKNINITIIAPLDLVDAATTPIWRNEFPFSFHITEIHSTSDTDDVDFTLKLSSYTNLTALTTIEAITIDTNGTGVYYDDITSGIDSETVVAGNLILFDNDATDEPDWIQVNLVGYFDADVN